MKRKTGKTEWKLGALACCMAGVATLVLPSARAGDEANATASRDLAEALRWVKSEPRTVANYEYVMTARVRLLVFWAGKDDVGGGYIRRGYSTEDERLESIQVLFGSDPAKAPRAINRWGGGTEILLYKDGKGANGSAGNGEDVVASAFFGFMKSSKGKSAAEMQEELKREKEKGEHMFTGILSRVDSGRAVSVVVPLASHTDFNLHQYREAEPLILEKLEAMERPIKEMKDLQGCGRRSEFLATVLELINGALNGEKGPKSLCYIYDAWVHMVQLERVTPVKKLSVQVKGAKGGTMVERTYEDVLEIEFASSSRGNNKRSEFTMDIGTKGVMRGVPVQIRYQPNWWFQVVLNLRPEAVTQKSSQVDSHRRQGDGGGM